MDNIGYLLMKVAKELRYELTNELKSFEITTSQWAVLKRLEIEEKSKSPYDNRTAVEIASKLDFDKPTISGIITRLFEKGMIKKEPHPNDKRAIILFLSEDAKEIIPKIELVSDRVIEQSLSSFTTEERELFLFLLKKMDIEISKGENPR
ncbi:MarR family transcriptional regulator [Neobacillus niacini]|uniref:MarR family winged helix-turn-helix transcriptional regulator n=1 Tax=Neobacillus niacini TaxID=86668 RepID=UPI002FFDFFD9